MRGAEKKRQVLNQELKRRNYRGETVAGVKFGPGKKMMTQPDEGVPPVSEERREKGIPVRERFPGPRARSGAGPDCFPGVQFHIFIFFSSFLF
jgi:hypothetical protein